MIVTKGGMSVITLMNELKRLVNESSVESIPVDFVRKTPGFIHILSLGGNVKRVYTDNTKIYLIFTDGRLVNGGSDAYGIYHNIEGATWLITGAIFPPHGNESNGSMNLTIHSKSGKVRNMLVMAIHEAIKGIDATVNVAY
ncbi:hypothetical protein [Vulcanisaeta distributa]|uniref:Uncharacterized protein n=1 Tax=Vulcanisaeta distributa (strain DSM 14429 / JCM 11212 / NBRC 100878 / IC-017) TaxID=572478 RepID=E1QT68_VULDI|nr:hypothetical protein [Vulcanisaeta distributa]ADN49660.1 hypothetical protein Vdis_0250 [Vulcanisaeta distributa DSM 14429]